VEHFEETPSTPTLDSVKEAMEAFPSDSVYYFARSDSEIQKEDLQPYSLIQNDEGKSILMAFLEGTFPSYENNDTHMPEHYVITDYVEGKLGEVWGQQEEDLTKVLKVIRTETFKREFTNLFIPRGMITLIAGTGEIFSYAKNDIAGSYPWGWTSNKLDYLEGGAVSNTVSKAGQTLAEKLKASAGKTTSVPITAPKTDTKIPDKVVPDEEITVPHFTMDRPERNGLIVTSNSSPKTGVLVARYRPTVEGQLTSAYVSQVIQRTASGSDCCCSERSSGS